MDEVLPDIPDNRKPQGWFATRGASPNWVNGAIFRLIGAVVGLVVIFLDDSQTLILRFPRTLF